MAPEEAELAPPQDPRADQPPQELPLDRNQAILEAAKQVGTPLKRKGHLSALAGSVALQVSEFVRVGLGAQQDGRQQRLGSQHTDGRECEASQVLHRTLQEGRSAGLREEAWARHRAV